MEPPPFTIDVKREKTEAVISVAGEIDVSTVAQLNAAVGEVLVEAPPRVVLDLGGVTFCDSQGLGTLVALTRKARMVQCALVITNVGDFLIRVLDITGLRTALLISDS
jgi:anti-sigma B factor antagonist